MVVPFGPTASLKITGQTPSEVLADLTAVERSEIPMTLGRVTKAVEPQEALGRILGAELVEEHPKPEPPEWATVGLPGAPIINGEPAWFVKSASAFVSPVANPDNSLPRTDNPDDPRLASGQALFFQQVR